MAENNPETVKDIRSMDSGGQPILSSMNKKKFMLTQIAMRWQKSQRQKQP